MIHNKRRTHRGKRRSRRKFSRAAAVLTAMAALVMLCTWVVEAARPGLPAMAIDMPQITPVPEITVAPTASAAPVDSGEAGAFEYLPVYRSAKTDLKRIAITVDDCYQVDNLKTIIRTAYDNGGKLTLFPIGENLSRPGMVEVIRGSVFQLGFEVENHTWSHQRIFRLSEQEMAREIWAQGQALNRVLGVNYRQHFFRLMGGDGSSDQRTHNYLEQLGFKGIAEWSLSGSDADMDMIVNSLAPGKIYLFHTTDGDTEKLKQFIPYAVSRGYSLVTLNELLDFEANATEPYAPSEIPTPRAYRPDYREHKQGDYAWIIVQMQNRLRELGYLVMDGPSTGYFGAQTARAIQSFQQDHNLNPTGVADPATQRLLL